MPASIRCHVPRSTVRSRRAFASFVLGAVALLGPPFGRPLTAQGPTREAAAAAAAAAPAMREAMIVSTDWLTSRLDDPSVIVVEITRTDSARAALIPGARPLAYRHFVERRDSLSTELPSLDSLRTLVEGLGISDDTHVVVYAQEAPMATRFLLTLHLLGLDRASYLDGGLPKWRAEGRRIEREEPGARRPVARGRITPRPRLETIVTADWLDARVGRPGLSLIDTRTTGEYTGTGNRSGMPSAGHLEGARQLEWEQMFDSAAPLTLKPREALRDLFAERVTPGDTVVTYCWVGYRASATWFMARALGYDPLFYDGSYQDWQRRQLPTRAGVVP